MVWRKERPLAACGKLREICNVLKRKRRDGERERSMQSYNDIGIDRKLDWPRIRKLLVIGVIASIMVFIGDMLLGYGVEDRTLSGFERMLSAYAGLSDRRIFWGGFLGFLGIPLEGLCYFGIYRLMAERSPKHAHAYRSGILGYLIFGGCGVHLPFAATAYLYKYMQAVSPAAALQVTIRFGTYFLMPGTILFFLFFVVLCAAQISAFAKGFTPYPRWCWIFSLPVGMLIAFCFNAWGNVPLANGLSMAWISIGNLWMFAGLLIMMKKAAKKND